MATFLRRDNPDLSVRFHPEREIVQDRTLLVTVYVRGKLKRTLIKNTRKTSMKMQHLFALAILAMVPSTAFAQSSGSEEDIQFRSIDFTSQVLELHNYGDTSWDLDGWRFCTHDVSDGFDYTSTGGLNGTSIAAGDSLASSITFNTASMVQMLAVSQIRAVASQ